MQVLTPSEARVVRTLGQAMFPREADGLPDARDADVVGYVDGMLAAALPFERAQLRALFQLFDRGYGAFIGQPSVRVAEGHLDQVEDYLRSWEESGLYERRMIFEGLRGVFLMAWFGGDRVRAETGVDGAPDPHDPMAFLSALAAGQDEAEAAESARLRGPSPRPELFLDRPAGLFEHGDYKGDLREDCDFLVIGSGPGGAIAAVELARSGKRVILLEAGPVARKDDLVRDGGMSMTRLMWDSGMRTTTGNIIAPTMQAKVLGGGSIINSAICLRPTEAALGAWADDWGVEGLSLAELAPHLDAVERFMGVKQVDDAVQGQRNVLFALGAKAVGLNATPIARNESGCLGSGGCLYGCVNGAKLSHDRRGVPELLALGGRVYTSVQVDRLVLRNGRVHGVEAVLVEPWTGRVTGKARFTARCTVLAAGVMATPVICQRSGIDSPAVGSNLRMHPGTVVAGEFPEPVHPWYGATQGYHVLDQLDFGIKLESLWADPALMAFRMPSVGKQLKRQLTRYRNMATWDAWVSGEDSVGSVRQLPGSPRPSIRYDIGLGDIRRLQHATATLAGMFFAVGAERVYPGVAGLPPVLHGPDDVPLLRSARIDHRAVPSGSNHVFGTMPMGADPTRSATDSFGAVHGVDDLYVCDTSLLPGSPAANPMLTLWALAHRQAATLVERYA